MSVLDDLKLLINTNITQNTTRDITGTKLNTTLITMAEDLYNVTIDTGTTFKGDAGSYSIISVNDTAVSATGDYSMAIGSGNTASGDNSFVVGYYNTVSHDRSVVLGGSGITSDDTDTVYVPNLKTLGLISGGTLYGDGSNLTGIVLDAFTGGTVDHLIVTNNVTATTYYGDGSNLTGIVADSFTGGTVSYINATENITAVTYYGDGSQLTGIVLDAYTKDQADANFLSANTSYYTQAEVDGNFLSANTSYYTQAEVDGNFLSANTSYYTQSQIDTTFTNYYLKAESDANYLSANTSYYTQSQIDTTFGNYYLKAESDANYLSANTSLFDGAFSSLTGIPTTLSGYTITDAVDNFSEQFIGGNKTFTDNVLIYGNFTVSGTTTFLNTEDLNIKDNIILLNSGETGSGVSKGTAGVQIDRGTATDASFIWDEVTDKFKLGLLGSEIAISLVGDSYTKVESDANYLSANTSYYTQTEVDNLVDDYLPLTGGELTGALTATTISAQTYYGDGSQLTGFATEIVQISGATGYTINNADTSEVIYHTEDAITITISTAQLLSKRIVNIKNVSDGTITIETEGAETIDGDTSKIISSYENITLYNFDSNWFIK